MNKKNGPRQAYFGKIKLQSFACGMAQEENIIPIFIDLSKGYISNRHLSSEISWEKDFIIEITLIIQWIPWEKSKKLQRNDKSYKRQSKS